MHCVHSIQCLGGPQVDESSVTGATVTASISRTDSIGHHGGLRAATGRGEAEAGGQLRAQPAGGIRLGPSSHQLPLYWRMHGRRPAG